MTSPTAGAPTDREALEALADALWAERHLVDHLLFKLVTAKLLLAGGEGRFLLRAMDEVERVIKRLQEGSQRREAALAPVAAAWGRPPAHLSLAALVPSAPEPMATVFADLHDSFLRLTAEIEQTAAADHRLGSQALREVQSTLDMLTSPAPTTPHTAPASARDTVGRRTAGAIRFIQVL